MQRRYRYQSRPLKSPPPRSSYSRNFESIPQHDPAATSSGGTIRAPTTATSGPTTAAAAVGSKHNAAKSGDVRAAVLLHEQRPLLPREYMRRPALPKVSRGLLGSCLQCFAEP